MSKSINQVLLIGHVGKDPEFRTTNNVKVAKFSLATSTGGYKKQDGTEVPLKTQWHNIVCFRSLAEAASKYVTKGDKITIIGSISYNEYEKDGAKRTFTEIVAEDIVLPTKSGEAKQESEPDPFENNDMPF